MDGSERLRAEGGEAPLEVVLVTPEIPPNTGNVARLCAATRSHLHLVHPLGFSVDEKAVRRAGLDYWHLVSVREHESWSAFERSLPKHARLFFFTGKTARSYLETKYRPGDYLVFGKESTGLSEAILEKYQEQTRAIPTLGDVRSLNLANAVAIAVYEALRQTGQLDRVTLRGTPKTS